MGQAYSEAWGESNDQLCKVKPDFIRLKTVWRSVSDLSILCIRLKSISKNFNLSKIQFFKLLQLEKDTLSIETWFHSFSSGMAASCVDGLEFVSACILLNRDTVIADKIRLLFKLFDLDDTDNLRRDDFTLFLR